MNMITEEEIQEVDCIDGQLRRDIVDMCHRPEDDLIVSSEPLFIAHPGFMRNSYFAKTPDFVIYALECLDAGSIIVSIYTRHGEYTYGLGPQNISGYTQCYLFKGTPVLAVKVFGRNWGRIVDWVNEFMEYGVLEDAFSDHGPTSYIK